MAETSKPLRVASFRGAVFHVTETDHTTGRRVVVHEYPERDTPFTEDLGRSARTFTVKGFFVGADYVEQMKAFQEKFEQRGAGELVHPWLGRMMVTPQGLTVHYSLKLLRADFDATFSESGEQTYPSQEADPAYVVKEKAEALKTSSLAALARKIKVSSLQDYVAKQIVGNINKALGIDAISEINQVFGISEDIASTMNEAISLLGSGASGFAVELAGALGLSRFASAAAAWRAVAKNVGRICDDDKLNTETSVLHSEGTQSYEIAMVTEAFNGLIRQVSIANAVGAVANIGTELDKPNTSDAVPPLAYEDLIAIRDDLLATIDREALKVEDDELYQALQDARAAVWLNLTTKAESKARLVTYTPSSVLPAVVIAYEFYGDANRDLELIERNRIARPGFVPVVPLKLLSE